jgi:RNA recognition motif-containing protein
MSTRMTVGEGQASDSSRFPHLWVSRLIVKNLPSDITSSLLKVHFSQSKCPRGTIADVKVALKQDGIARRFRFIGFKTDEDALKAKNGMIKHLLIRLG